MSKIPLLLRLPIEIDAPLRKESEETNQSVQSLALSILAKHVGVSELPETKMGRPKKIKIDIQNLAE